MKINEDGSVTLTAKEWEGYKESDRILMALEEAGVDNWEGYSNAFQDEEDDEDDDED